MPKTVLDVGNCEPDHASIRHLLTRHFGAQVLQAHGINDTLELLTKHQIDLVLVNRKLDQDYSDGLDVVRKIKAETQFSSVPVMLVTNYQEHQQLAIDAGAVQGFGKLALRSPETHSRLAAILVDSDR
jgi:CheY-like chemotaxis protein